MANEVVGQVAVKVVPDSTGFSAALASQLGQAAGQSATAGQAIGRALGQANSAAQQLGETVGGIASNFGNVAVAVGAVTAAMKASQFAAQKLANFLGGVFDVSTKARIGFTALLGDADKANTLLDQVTKLATDSPFETEPLIEASQRLLGVGKAADTIVPTLEHVGDLISAMGGDPTNIESVLYALTQIQTVGRLTGQDAMQLKNSLIPITKLLAESLGKTQADIQKMQEAGQISAQMVFDALDKAGVKVAGSMANAVNTVSGGLSVLRDTIQGLYRQSPFLQKLYVDVVQGIKSLAGFVGGPVFTAAFNKAGDAAMRVYEALKPVLEAFAEIGQTTTLQVLGLAATALNAIATALNAIPEPVLKLLITGLLLNRSIRGVQAIQQLAGSIGQMAQQMVGLGRATTEAGDAAAVAGNKWARWGAQAAAAAALVAGSVVSDGKNGTRDVVGGALSMAGAGASIGSTFGPYGAAIGAGAGAVLGLYQSFSANAEAKAQEHRDKMAEIGRQTGEEYLKGISGQFTTSSGAAALTEQLAAVQKKLDDQRKKVEEAEAYRDSLGGADAFLNAILPTPGIETERERRQKALEEERAYLLQIQTEYDTLDEGFKAAYGTQLDGLKALLPLLNQESAGYKALTEVVASGDFWSDQVFYTRVANENLVEVEASLKRYGITLSELTPAAAQDLAIIIARFDGLTTAQQDATLAATALAKSWADAKALSDTIYKDQLANLNQVVAVTQSRLSMEQAINAAAKDTTDELARQQAEAAIMSAAIANYNEAYARIEQAYIGQGLGAEQAKTAAKAAAERAYADTFVQAEKMKAEAASDAAYAISLANAQQAESAHNAGLIIRATAEQNVLALEKLAHVADTMANRQIVIDIVTKGIEEALAKIELLKQQLATLVSSRTASGDDVRNLNLAIQRQKHIAEILAGNVPDDLGILKPVSESISAAVAAAARKGPKKTGPDLAKEWAEKVKSAGESLQSAIESAMEAVKTAAEAWKNTLKERTQYETAVSTGRALKNANRQISDLAFIQSGIAQLKARGLSEAALASLDINGITDYRQIRKLLKSDPSQLAALSAAVENRDRLAGAIASDRQREESRKTITEAIIAAAALLGYKITDEQARNISATFEINSSIDSKIVASDILSALSGGKITR